jgi:hypothetical protein
MKPDELIERKVGAVQACLRLFASEVAVAAGFGHAFAGVRQSQLW